MQFQMSGESRMQGAVLRRPQVRLLLPAGEPLPKETLQGLQHKNGSIEYLRFCQEIQPLRVRTEEGECVEAR